MPDIALVADSTGGVVESIQQHTAPCAVDISPRTPVRFDANGKFVPARGNTAPNAKPYGVSSNVKTVKAGFPVTAIKRGVLDGFNFTQAYGSDIFLSDTEGKLSDAAGTISVKVGTVVSGWAQTLGNSADKLLSVEL